MPQVALLAEFEVKAEDLELFLAAAKRELEAARAREPGCLRCDVFLFDEAGKGAFAEVFEDQAAADGHRDTPHFAAFFDETAEIDVTWSVRRGTALAVR